ncbi:MAG: ArnT family glycosyltransferase [Tepidisphaeraceae bacterium]
MSDPPVVAGLMLLAGVVFFAGITWGLPSRAVDPYLFGDHPVWSGAEIARLAGTRADDADRGADVDVNPLARRDGQPIVLNATDAQRAEIIRRYRLYTYQPDEMITLMSLSKIRQNKGDPRLYQYGGLWVYPVGVLLKLSSMLGLIDLRADVTYYLDHPEAFGRFYVVARAYSAAWGVAGVWAVFWITRRLTGPGSLIAPITAALCYTFMPVVVNMAHEAKPHLPGAVLMLFAVMAATKYVETGRTRWWVWTGVACGAAFGMVLSAMWAFAVIPVMVMLRKDDPWRRRVVVMFGAGAIGLAVYFATNPYVLVNALTNPEPLRSNLANSKAMYAVHDLGAGVVNAAWLIAEGASPFLALLGVVGCAVLVWRRVGRGRQGACDTDCAGRGDVGWLLLFPGALIVAQFASLAAGKPGEYGRFALFVDVALAVAAVTGLDTLAKTTRQRVGLAIVGVLVTAPFGIDYLRAFLRDTRPVTSRLAAAEQVRRLPDRPLDVGVLDEPAPYVMPPVDLFRHRVVLVPSGPDPWRRCDVLVGPLARVMPHKRRRLKSISWADIRVEVHRFNKP